MIGGLLRETQIYFNAIFFVRRHGFMGYRYDALRRRADAVP